MNIEEGIIKKIQTFYDYEYYKSAAGLANIIDEREHKYLKNTYNGYKNFFLKHHEILWNFYVSKFGDQQILLLE
jgi:hypothetical protein